MRTISLVISLLLSFLLIGVANDDAIADEKRDKPTVKYGLAVIDAGKYIPKDDPRIRKYARVLDGLEEKCPDKRERLGDFAVVSQRLLAEAGETDSILDVLRGVRRSMPNNLEPDSLGSCSNIFALYVSLRIANG